MSPDGSISDKKYSMLPKELLTLQEYMMIMQYTLVMDQCGPHSWRHVSLHPTTIHASGPTTCLHGGVIFTPCTLCLYEDADIALSLRPSRTYNKSIAC